jgi:hypothetical protein
MKIWGFFVSVGLSPGTLPQVIRFAHPFRAALKRVLLRSRVQVAEPNSKHQTSARLYFVGANLSLPTNNGL